MRAAIKFSDPMHPDSGRPVAVRTGHQGYGSVELDVSGLDAFGRPAGEPWWLTLDEVMVTPGILGVVFQGPWHKDDLRPVESFMKPVEIVHKIGGVYPGTPKAYR